MKIKIEVKNGNPYQINDFYKLIKTYLQNKGRELELEIKIERK